MEMLCPECMGQLDMIDAEHARCTVHGGQYEVLFLRQLVGGPMGVGDSGSGGIAPAAPDTFVMPCPSCAREWTVGVKHMGKEVRCTDCESTFVVQHPDTESDCYDLAAEECQKHPGVTAEYSCGACGASICETCVFPGPNGGQLCPDCVVGGGPGVRPGIPDFSVRGRLQGKQCVNHSEVPAAHLCKSCGAAVCETCTFKFPGNLFVCPSCAASPKSAFGPKQKQCMIGSFLCAAGATLVMFFTFLLLPEPETIEEAEAVGSVMVLLVLGLSIAGTALSAASRVPRQPTPVGVWVALVWNVILLAGMLLLCLVGALMGA